MSNSKNGLARPCTNVLVEQEDLQPVWWLIADIENKSIFIDIMAADYMNRYPKKIDIWAFAFFGSTFITKANIDYKPIGLSDIGSIELKYKKLDTQRMQIWLKAGSFNITKSRQDSLDAIIQQDPPEDAISVTQGYSAV